MARLMKSAMACQFDSALTIGRVPIPSLRPDEVVVKIMATGVSHTR